MDAAVAAQVTAAARLIDIRATLLMTDADGEVVVDARPLIRTSMQLLEWAIAVIESNVGVDRDEIFVGLREFVDETD